MRGVDNGTAHLFEMCSSRLDCAFCQHYFVWGEVLLTKDISCLLNAVLLLFCNIWYVFWCFLEIYFVVFEITYYYTLQ